MPPPMSEIQDAVLRFFKAKGAGHCFPSDEVWQYFQEAEPAPVEKPGLVKGLARANYIVPTGRTTKAISGARKGSPTKEYTFGAAISPDSLKIANSRYTPETNSKEGALKDDVHHPLDVPHNTNGKFPLPWARQRIVHGCPGSGKSYLLEKEAAQAHYVIRTVLHPESSYSEFVGALRPQSIYKVLNEHPIFSGSSIDVPGEPYVQYVVQAGSLLKAYYLACAYPDRSVVLIIEELSRAVAAHVFGDTLQLLDRIEDKNDPLSGYSTYEIEPRPDIWGWLMFNEVWHDHVSLGNMRLPPNLYIWATMNRADQNARQLDAAFLRRWDKQYLSYLTAGSYDDSKVRYGGKDIAWGDLRSHINEKLKALDGVSEDKFIGPYMLPVRKLGDSSSIYEDLWGYIWNDVLKTRSPLFFEGIRTFADLEKAWAQGNGAPIGPIEP